MYLVSVLKKFNTSPRSFIEKCDAFFCNCRKYNEISHGLPEMVSLTTIKRSLKSQQIKLEDGHACLIVDCPMCGPHDPQTKTKVPRLYINKTTGFFVCQCCKYNGPWNLYERFLNCKSDKSPSAMRELLKEMESKECFRSKNLTEKTKLFSKLSQKQVTTVLEKLDMPVEYASALLSLNARVSETEQIYVPLTDTENSVTGYRLLDSVESTLPVRDARGIIVGRTCSGRTGSSHAVIVPSLKDALILLTARVPASVICLPYGLNSLPQIVLPQLEKFSRLTLWFGSDLHSWDSARNFAKKLGEKRCYFVRPTEGQQSISVAVAQGQDVKAILASAQPLWHKAITTFASLRQDVLSELQNIDIVQGVKWKRFPLLSRILRGHRRGELTVLTGPTGCGKTTFVSEYSLDLALQGVSTLWGSFEIRNARLARTMLQQLAGCELNEHLELFDNLADEFERLPIFFMTFHGQQPIKLVMEAVEHATYVHDIAHVVIDNVQFMLGMSEFEHRHADRFWKQDAIVAAFRAFATRNNCHVTLVMHPRKERDTEELSVSSIFGGAKASQEADNVLIIQDKRLSSLRGKKYLQVVKNRYSGDLGVMPMEFDRAALSYAYKKKKSDEKTSSKEPDVV